MKGTYSMTERFGGLTVAYSEKFLDWQLSDESVVNPLRAYLTLEGLRGVYGSKNAIDILTNWANASEQEEQLWVSAARSFEGEQADEVLKAAQEAGLEDAVLSMFGATFALTQKLVRDRAFEKKHGVYFNPAGGESAAHEEVKVFNDLGWAAARLADAGLRVAVLDWDAHHAAETERLLAGRPEVVTLSIHDRETAQTTYSNPEAGFFNFDLGAGAGDVGFVEAVRGALEVLADLQLDVLILNIGADGLADDNYSSLEYTLEGFGAASLLVAQFVLDRKCSVLIGGGGGHLPLDQTPEVWESVLKTILTTLLMDEELRNGGIEIGNAGTVETFEADPGHS